MWRSQAFGRRREQQCCGGRFFGRHGALAESPCFYAVCTPEAAQQPVEVAVDLGRQFFAALTATCRDDGATSTSPHTETETVRARATPVVRLERPLALGHGQHSSNSMSTAHCGAGILLLRFLAFHRTCLKVRREPAREPLRASSPRAWEPHCEVVDVCTARSELTYTANQPPSMGDCMRLLTLAAEVKLGRSAGTAAQGCIMPLLAKR
jgi:hypothetical protein